MLNRKCRRCARKIEKDFDFCPYCGNDFRIEKKAIREKDFGFLGKDDLASGQFPSIKMPFGFEGLFNSLMSQIDGQFREIDREIQKPSIPRKNANSISISISSMDGKKPEIKLSTSGPEFKQFKETEIERPKISDEQAKMLSKLPKKEAETKVRRMSRGIIYEIELPNVKNQKDIIINQLENSVEIKAFSEDTAYFKLLPVNLPIADYRLKDGVLTIEFRHS